MYLKDENAKPTRVSVTQKIIDIAHKTGLIRTGRSLWAKSLTVINYHRIDDLDRAGFDSFKPNVSASPAEFNNQMDYLARWFNVISVRAVIDWLNGNQSLPPYAALITFDDGYLDNYTNAYPILHRYNFPAVIFLATDHIGTDAPFYWDLAAYCFHHTQRDGIAFPDNTQQRWVDSTQRDQICKTWIESMKVLPEAKKQDFINKLPGVLDVSIPQNFFRNLMTNWDQVREMSRDGIEFGAHTMSHPILTRIPLDQARAEIQGSKNKIQHELGQEVLSFAYPNGMSSDFNAQIEQEVAGSGIRAAFTLLNGPSSMREVRRNPFAIRRIFISHNHSLSRYAALLSPLNRYRSN